MIFKHCAHNLHSFICLQSVPHKRLASLTYVCLQPALPSPPEQRSQIRNGKCRYHNPNEEILEKQMETKRKRIWFLPVNRQQLLGLICLPSYYN